MKFMKFKNILLAVLVLTAFSCEDFIGGDLNADPNKPLTVPVTGQIGQIQIQLADTYGGEFSRWNCMFTQQVEGVARQWSSFNQYTITANRFDFAWSDIYENVIVELRTVTRVAEENGYNHYLGVAKVIEAYTMMMATEVWGDIPYSEAGYGSENFNPAYDTQASIYTAVVTLLGEAKTLFAGPAGAIAPGTEDLYYGGDVAAWTRAADAILARYYLHQGDLANALTSAQASFTSRADNMGYQYGNDPASAPWYRFNNGREGDIEFHPTMRGIMSGLNDTDRLGVMDQTFTINGTPHPYFIAGQRQELISYREIQFIIAEAALTSNPAAAHAAYLAGIDASFQELGFAAGGAEYAAYVAQPAVDPGVGSITLTHVMTQKYIGMFAQPEVWTDWRRNGIPALTPVSGGAVPTSWDYANQTYLFNTNAPTQLSGTGPLLRNVLP
jgi:hypothetical protein